MIKISLHVEQTMLKLLWGVNYPNRDVMSMPWFYERLTINGGKKKKSRK